MIPRHQLFPTRTRLRPWLSLALLPCLLLPCLLLLWAPAARAAVPVAFLSDGSELAQQLEERVLLDERFARAPLEQAQLLFVLGQTPPQESWQALLERVRAGAGLVLVPGQTLPDLAPLGLSARGEQLERVSLSAAEGLPLLLAEDVSWTSAPQAARRHRLQRQPSSPLLPLAHTESRDSPVLLRGPLGQGQVVVFSLQLTDRSNRELVLWPYFNYLLYVLSSEAAGEQAERFARWPHAPVPGLRALGLLLGVFSVAWVVTLLCFFRARRYSRRHPEILQQFFAGAAQPAAPGSAAPGPGLASPTGGKGRAAAGWQQVGFTRPLAGFLTLTGAMFVLFAPFYYITNILIPNQVQPFPQAKGMWDFAWEALQIAWFLFDAGTFVAFVKYFAEYRLKDPAEALRSTQFFVWWQILTGLVQVTLAGLAAVLILPHTRYGFSSNFVILIALSQYPGFFGVVTFFFQAYQRFDYNIALDLLSDWVLRFALMIPTVLLFRAWGAAHPAYGEAFGAAVGIGVGFYLSSVVTFAIGVGLYKRLGLQLTPLFLAHFDRQTASRMLRFGIKVVAGQAFFRAAKTIDKVVISLLLLNYTEWLGIESQIHYNLMFLFPVAYRFFETAMAALSESYGNGKRVLTQYYLVRFLQVGFLYTAIGLSLLWALGPLFIHNAMDPQWARAGDYLVIAAVIGAFYAPAWLSDMLQKGAGRPGLFALVLGAEQVLRIGLFFVLIPLWQFQGFYLALLFTIALKVVGGWIVNHLLIVRLRLYLWQMLAAPALAGALNYLVLIGLSQLLPLQGRWPVIGFFFAAALLSFYVCFFAAGLVGGFDRALAGELDQASRMTGALRPLTRSFYHVARAGWTLSPLHDRFPVSLQAQALAEARELEAGRPTNNPPAKP